MKYEISELQGNMLDRAVAKAEGLAQHPGPGEWIPIISLSDKPFADEFFPSRLWEHGGPIIEREGIDLEHGSDGCRASLGRACEWGASDLLAAMRAYVAYKFGSEIELP